MLSVSDVIGEKPRPSTQLARRSTHSATQHSEKLFVPAGTDVQLGGGDRERTARSNIYSLVAAVVAAAAAEVAPAVVYGGAAVVTERRWKDGERGESSLYNVSVMTNYCQTFPFRLFWTFWCETTNVLLKQWELFKVKS